MVRKISIVLMIVVLTITCSCVVFGATFGSLSGVYYSVFDFDYISSEDIETGDEFTYPFVGGTVSQQTVNTDGYIGTSSADFVGTANYLTTDNLSGQYVGISTYSTERSARWTFHADTVYWSSGLVLEVSDYNDNVAYTNININFEVVDLVDSSGQYEVVSIPIRIGERAEGSRVLLHSMINERLDELDIDLYTYRLDNFTISVEGVGDSGEAIPYYLVLKTSVSDSPSHGANRAQNWLNGYDLPVPSAQAPVVATEFLTDILEPFLGFEIIPGVSMGGVLAFVATVALVFWFITLLV